MIAPGLNERVHALHTSVRHQRPTRKERNNERYPASKPRNPCLLCGASHWTRECTYKAHKCRDCARIGHREGFCASYNRRGKRDKFNHHKFAASKVVQVNVCGIQQNRKYVNILIGKKPARLQLDTGSDISVISQRIWKQLGRPDLVPVTVKAKAASGDTLELKGEFTAHVSIGNKVKQATIRVSRAELALLGADLVTLFSL